MGRFFGSSDSKKEKKAQEFDDNEIIVIVDRSIDPHLVVFHDPNSYLSEQYRHFRTNMMALNTDGSPQSLVFTSSNKGEGKSVSVANIALSMVETANMRVCLIDADFRAPSIGKMFGLEEGPGLSDLLLDRLALNKVLTPTKMENLHVIQAGRSPRNTTELLDADSMVDLIKALKQDFQYILFDTPPVFPYTDACILGAKSNGIVLVIKMDHTNRTTVDKTIRSLEAAGGSVVGTFLTAIRPSEKEESRSYYYYSDDDAPE